MPARVRDRHEQPHRLALVVLGQLRQREDLDHRRDAANLDKFGEVALTTRGGNEHGDRLQLQRHGVAQRVGESQPRRDASEHQARAILQLVLELRAGHVGAARDKLLELLGARGARARVPSAQEGV